MKRVTPHGVVPDSVTSPRVNRMERVAPPAEWALGPKEVRYIHDAAAQMSEHSSEDEADSDE